MWSIVQVRSMQKMILNYRDLSDLVWCVMKTKQDNDMIDHIGVVYTENKTKLL